MKNSRPLPAKRTIGAHRGANNHQPKSPRHSSKRPPQHQQQEATNSESKSINQSNKLDNNENEDTANTNPICDICAQNVPGPERERIFAFGKCDHHVCYVCSARLRAICDQPECPICREKLDNVIFSANKDRLYDKHDVLSYIYDSKYRIYFEDSAIQDAFKKLLKFECLQCLKDNQTTKSNKKISEPPKDTTEFQDVSKLKQHLNYVHKLRLCDLCLTHNNLFPFEYSYYDNASLRRHQKDGEPNTSHRGHPDCVLCHNTFFNQDELLQHMSREHFHCHLCGRHNSTMHIYFLDYNSLRLHFKAEHFLCERGNCRHQEFTSAFDSQIDYQLHIFNVHGGSANASRGEARQQRTITLDSAPHRQPTTSIVPRNAAVVLTGTLATANASDPRRQIPDSIRAQMLQQRLPSRSDFPTLGDMGTSFNGSATSQTVNVNVSSTSSSQFPSLVQAPSSSQASRSVPTYRITAGPSTSRVAFNTTAGGGMIRPDQLNQMDFPPLPEQPKLKGSKSKSRQSKATDNDGGLTLDQLINNSLVLSSRDNSSKAKNKSSKTNKSSRQRPLKFQL